MSQTMCRCGTVAKKLPRRGKRRFRHKCPHGVWCDFGHPIKGVHAVENRACPKCVAIVIERERGS